MDTSSAYPDLDDPGLYSFCEDCENTDIDKSLPSPKENPMTFYFTYNEKEKNIQDVIAELLTNKKNLQLDLRKGVIVEINKKFKIMSEFYYSRYDIKNASIYDIKNPLVLKISIYDSNFCVTWYRQKFCLNFFYLLSYDGYLKNRDDCMLNKGDSSLCKTYGLDTEYLLKIIKILEVLIKNKFFFSNLMIPSKSYFENVDENAFDIFSNMLVEYVEKYDDNIKIDLWVILKDKNIRILKDKSTLLEPKKLDFESYTVKLSKDKVGYFKDL